MGRLPMRRRRRPRKRWTTFTTRRSVASLRHGETWTLRRMFPRWALCFATSGTRPVLCTSRPRLSMTTPSRPIRNPSPSTMQLCLPSPALNIQAANTLATCQTAHAEFEALKKEVASNVMTRKQVYIAGLVIKCYVTHMTDNAAAKKCADSNRSASTTKFDITPLPWHHAKARPTTPTAMGLRRGSPLLPTASKKDDQLWCGVPQRLLQAILLQGRQPLFSNPHTL